MTVTNPSKAYQVALADAARHHANSKTYSGSLMRPHAPAIKLAIDKLGCKSVLDYGAGKGTQYEWLMPDTGQTIEQYWGVPVTKYDPAWPPFATEPVGKFDLVICTHTLGAIPESDLGWVLDRIYSLAAKGVYIAEQVARGDKPVTAGKPVHVRAALDWIDLIYPRRVEGVETVFAARYDRSDGKISGAFVF
jgi:hypothetical protein